MTASSSGVPATGTEPAPLIQELVPSGWIVAGGDDDLFEWFGEIHRNSADAVTELRLARSQGYRTWQMYALYSCPDPIEGDR